MCYFNRFSPIPILTDTNSMHWYQAGTDANTSIGTPLLCSSQDISPYIAKFERQFLIEML